jgi:hypothetical protein
VSSVEIGVKFSRICFRQELQLLVGVDGVVQAVEDQGRTDGFGEVVTVEVGAGVPGNTGEPEYDASTG